ncbi:MAG: nucleoside phosphorylase [Microbacteriaceae bacterium]|jgi:uridine phosphorylase|nr:MAG: uridine phosphorylase [Microbacteriaceae bacterium BACL25 MAG-120322-bin65]HAA80045.1 uridine phosphorylase [Microbacteriaceae bacterium]
MSMDRDNPRQYHIELAPGDVGKYVFLPGDPGRCELIASYFDDAHKVASHREYETWSGFLDGEKVSVTSTGIGGPSAAIALEELVAIGATTFVRVGTSGAMQENIHPGDIAVVSGAIRDEGTSLHYLPLEFPAIADVDLTRALADSAKGMGKTVHVGISQSKDSFYGQHSPERMPIASRLHERWSAWIGGGAICSEMEAATLYIVASVLRVRAAGIMMVMGHPDQSPMTPAEWDASKVEHLLPVAIEGMKEIIRRDKAAS